MNNTGEYGSPTQLVSSEVQNQYLPTEDPASESQPKREDLSDIKIGDIAEFAILEPLNPAARRSFHDLASLSRKQELPYHSKFIRVYETKENSNKHISTDFFEGHDTERLLEGCYAFSLAELPEFPALGWRVGKGRPKEINRGVDLLLMDSDPSNDDIAGLHAIFNWVPTGGGFFLEASNTRGKPVYLNGKCLVHDQRLIPYENMIGIGNHTYSLVYSQRSPAQETQFQTELRTFFSTIYGEKRPIIQSTPSAQTHKIARYVMGHPIARGGYGIVFAATHDQKGTVVAVKQVPKTPGNSKNVEREMEILQLLKDHKHENIASPLDIIRTDCQSEASTARLIELLDETYRPGPSDILEMIYIVLPLQSATFNSLNTSSVSVSTRVIFYKQVLDGVAWMHTEGIAHRDLKPANLVVGQYDPPHAMIIDFGCAILEPEVIYDWPGTIPYLAPEQREGLKHGRSVDEWALGLVGTELFGRPRPQRQLTKDDYDEVHRWLARCDRARVPIADICGRMLQWLPSDRLLAVKALHHPSVAGYAYTQNELTKSFPSKVSIGTKRGAS